MEKEIGPPGARLGKADIPMKWEFDVARALVQGKEGSSSQFFKKHDRLKKNIPFLSKALNVFHGKEKSPDNTPSIEERFVSHLADHLSDNNPYSAVMRYSASLLLDPKVTWRDYPDIPRKEHRWRLTVEESKDQKPPRFSTTRIESRKSPIYGAGEEAHLHIY